MAKLVIIIFLSCIWCVAVCAEQDWYAPAPDHEIERANKFMEMKFGPDLFKNSISLSYSGIMNSQGELSGYVLCYRFVPINVGGTFAGICIERSLDGEYSHSFDGEIPDCANHPELCEVNVQIAEALKIAQENGFSAESRMTTIRLRFNPKYPAFVWRVEEIPEDIHEYTNRGPRNYFLINARTGEIEEKEVASEG